MSVASPMQYDAETIFNDKNAAQYLAEIEEYIGVLITNLAYKQDQPNAAIASIPLEKLYVKEFGQKKPDREFDSKIGAIERLDLTWGEDVDTDGEREELVTNPIELKWKFDEKWMKNPGLVSSILDSSSH